MSDLQKTKCRYCDGTGVLSAHTALMSIMGQPCMYCVKSPLGKDMIERADRKSENVRMFYEDGI